MGSRDHGLKSLKLLAKGTFSLCKWVFLDGCGSSRMLSDTSPPNTGRRRNGRQRTPPTHTLEGEGTEGRSLCTTGGMVRTGPPEDRSYHTVFSSHSRTHFTYGSIKSWKHGGEGWWKKWEHQVGVPRAQKLKKGRPVFLRAKEETWAIVEEIGWFFPRKPWNCYPAVHGMTDYVPVIGRPCEKGPSHWRRIIVRIQRAVRRLWSRAGTWSVSVMGEENG